MLDWKIACRGILILKWLHLLITSHMTCKELLHHLPVKYWILVTIPSPVLPISHLGQTNRTSSVLSHPVKSRRSSWVWATTSIRSQRNCCAELLVYQSVVASRSSIQFSLRRDFEASTSSWSTLLGQSFFAGILQTLTLPRQLVQDNIKSRVIKSGIIRVVKIKYIYLIRKEGELLNHHRLWLKEWLSELVDV